MQKRTNGKRRSFVFSREFDEVLEAQAAANGASLTENLRRGVFLRERVRLAGNPTPEHPQGERLCFQDIATGDLRPIDWL
jgi:hypothetical protein